MLGKIFSRQHDEIFSLFSHKIRKSLGDNLCEMIELIFWENKTENILKCCLLKCLPSMLSVENLSFDISTINHPIRGMFEMNCLFLSGDFKFQVSPKVLISCPRSTPRG